MDWTDPIFISNTIHTSIKILDNLNKVKVINGIKDLLDSSNKIRHMTIDNADQATEALTIFSEVVNSLTDEEIKLLKKTNIATLIQSLIIALVKKGAKAIAVTE